MTKNAIFLCTGNSCRSIMAEALLNHLGEGKFKTYSAGRFPTGEVHPRSIQTLKNNGIVVEGYRSKSWDEFAGKQIDIVITVCDAAAGETCPVFLGKHQKLYWSAPDPAKATGSEEEIQAAFDEVFEMLKGRIEKELL